MINSLIAEINAKLVPRYGFFINLDGYEETKSELDDVLDVDISELFRLNKEALAWSEYLHDVAAILATYTDKYKIVHEIYNYLMLLSKKNKTDFMIAAPKYRISTRDFDSAIIELQAKIQSNSTTVKQMQKLQKNLIAQSRLMLSHYYRTARLINQISKRSIRAAF